MIDDITTNKSAIIRRCLARVHEELGGDLSRLDDFTTQDAIVLNLLRSCEASIDLAMHQVAKRKLGIPQSSRDAFHLLESARLLSPDTAESMRHMVGFRNIAVHSYQEIQRPILEAILSRHLADFTRFLEELTRKV
jgi:uncharacterized protein YutE (UPF0331/DUF86 family)